MVSTAGQSVYILYLNAQVGNNMAREITPDVNTFSFARTVVCLYAGYVCCNPSKLLYVCDQIPGVIGSYLFYYVASFEVQLKK